MKRLSERVINIFLASFMALQAFANFHQFLVTGHHLRITHFLLMIDLGIIAFFFLIRRMPKTTSWKPWDILIASVGTLAPFFFSLEETGATKIVGVIFQILGICLVIWAVLSLNRSVGILPANRGIQTRGLYRFVRHPLYASYQVSNVGYLINHFSVYNVVILCIGLLAQSLRIFAEERHLSADPAYVAYKGKVRWRIFPFIF